MMIETLVGKTIVFLNNIQLAHWQTTSYSQHEALGEYYEKLNKLNDKLVETYQVTQIREYISRQVNTLYKTFKVLNIRFQKLYNTDKTFLKLLMI